MIVDSSEVPGGNQSPRVEVTPPPVSPDSDAVVGGVSETLGVSVSVAMAKGVTASSTTEGGDGGDGSEAGGGRATTGLGAVAPRSEEEARGRSEVVGGDVGEQVHAPRVQQLDSSVAMEGVVITGGGFGGGLAKKASEAHDGGSGGGEEERVSEARGGGLEGGEEKRVPEASPVRQPRFDLGKDPVVVEEVEE